MGKADESMYAVNLHESLSNTPDSSLILASSSSSKQNHSPSLDTSLNTAVKRKRRQKQSCRSDQSDPLPSSKRFNFSNNEQENVAEEECLIGEFVKNEKLLSMFLSPILILFS